VREPELARSTTSLKEGADETLEGRPDLPSAEGLKRSHSWCSSVAEPQGKEGEKGKDKGFRLEEGWRGGAGLQRGEGGGSKNL
jgi:hypothetical protein